MKINYELMQNRKRIRKLQDKRKDANKNDALLVLHFNKKFFQRTK